jgi:SAM-dependent methyltransferase
MKWLDRKLQEIRLRSVLPYIGAGARVLDLGCADGILADLIPSMRGYVGIDPDAPEHANSSVRTYVRGHFPSALAPGDEPFDVIVVTAVLEHVPRAEQPAFATACASNLVHGGRLALTVPAPAVDRILAILKRIALVDGMREDEHYGFDPSLTCGLFEASGFRLEHHRRFELGLNHLFVFQRTADVPPHDLSPARADQRMRGPER